MLHITRGNVWTQTATGLLWTAGGPDPINPGNHTFFAIVWRVTDNWKATLGISMETHNFEALALDHTDGEFGWSSVCIHLYRKLEKANCEWIAAGKPPGEDEDKFDDKVWQSRSRSFQHHFSLSRLVPDQHAAVLFEASDVASCQIADVLCLLTAVKVQIG